MSSDDEDNLCRFGTPLDPIEEHSVSTAKKITLADQIAVDSNGKRRFHGAFTGGFSAGFWNTVGSREGYTPSEFKSSRGEKASHRVQRPRDFMDDEDVGEFGIAPQRIQTTEDFGPTENRQKNKRKLQTDEAQGPIPGVPVLEFMLESCHDKAAVRLLKRMDKKYAATLAEKPDKPKEPDPIQIEDEPMENNDTIDPEDQSNEPDSTGKVYKCDMGPIMRPTRSNSTESDISTSDDDEELVFEDDEFASIFTNLKSNRFGLSYVGLDKGDFFTTVGSEAPIMHNNFNVLPTFTMVDQNKKKVTIKGQAFGVGAFEEDDDDIYGREDMSNYDFRMDSETKPKLAIKDIERGYISGFSEAKKTSPRIKSKNVFKVHLPFGYEPRNWLKRKSRFGPEVITPSSSSSVKGPADKVIGRHDLTPDQRGQILGGKKKDSVSDIEAKLTAAGLKTMNFTSGGVENKTDEPTISEDLSSKIDDTLAKFRNKPTFVVPETIPQILDRFTSSNDAKPLSELDPTEFSQKVKTDDVAATAKEIKKVIRTKSTWVPCQLLCYKMNMETNVGSKPEKGNTFSLFECIANTESARRNRLEFTGRTHEEDPLEMTKSDSKSNTENVQNETKTVNQNIISNPATSRWSDKPPIEIAPAESSELSDRNESKVDISTLRRSKPKTELEIKIIEAKDEHPSKKKDIFKAIFDSDSESDEDEADESTTNDEHDVMASLTKPSTSTSAIYSQLPDEAFRPKSAREINILRNTSPPRGIFSGLIKKAGPSNSSKSNEVVSSDKKNTMPDENKSESSDAYGPSLPPTKPSTNNENAKNVMKKPSVVSSTLSAVASVSLGKDYKVVYEEKWIEKSDGEKEKKSKKEKKHKKDREKHKSKKQKKEKHKKKKR